MEALLAALLEVDSGRLERLGPGDPDQIESSSEPGSAQLLFNYCHFPIVARRHPLTAGLRAGEIPEQAVAVRCVGRERPRLKTPPTARPASGIDE